MTADVAVLRLQELPEILLVQRKGPPYKDLWALPGGFVDVGETLEQAAVREAREETCLDVKLKILLGCYSSPQRDPRGHTVSPVYIAEARGVPQAADDAKNFRCVPVTKLPDDLVFDHGLILCDYRHYLQTGEIAPLGSA